MVDWDCKSFHLTNQCALDSNTESLFFESDALPTDLPGLQLSNAMQINFDKLI